VPLLAEALLSRVAPKRELHISTTAMNCLMAYGYPGNVRELRNVLERATLLCDGDTIQPADLPLEVQEVIHQQVAQAKVGAGETAHGASALGNPPPPTLTELEINVLRERLAGHRGNRKALAAELGISERTLYRKLRNLR
jgi:DNA-binding NtrC family response regulator